LSDAIRRVEPVRRIAGRALSHDRSHARCEPAVHHQRSRFAALLLRDNILDARHALHGREGGVARHIGHGVACQGYNAVFHADGEIVESVVAIADAVVGQLLRQRLLKLASDTLSPATTIWLRMPELSRASSLSSRHRACPGTGYHRTAQGDDSVFDACLHILQLLGVMNLGADRLLNLLIVSASRGQSGHAQQDQQRKQYPSQTFSWLPYPHCKIPALSCL